MIWFFLNYLTDDILFEITNLVIFLLFNLVILNLVLSLFTYNPIHSILFLALAFINFSLSLLAMGIQFISFAIVLIYVGAISILFMFVLMMLNINVILFRVKYPFFVPMLFLLFVIVIELFCIYKFKDYFLMYPLFFYINWFDIFYTKPELIVIGIYIFNFNPYWIFIISIILLIGLVGSISIVAEKTYIRKQYVHIQINSYLNSLTKKK